MYVILGLFALGLFAGLVLFAIIYFSLPDIDNAENLVAAESTVILDRDGNELYTLHGDENRKTVTFDQISPAAINAVIAIEDDKFYEHAGVDIPAVLKAVCGEIGVCSQPRGGSTITQQFVKKAFLTDERNYTRKAKEMLLSMQLEKRYTKDEIITMYLNRIPYGSNIYGIETASNIFFGKPAKDLTLAEAAILAGIPNRPTRYFPYGNNVHTRIELDPQQILDNDYRSESDIAKADSSYIYRGLLGKTYTFGEGEQARDIYVKGRVNFVLERMLDLKYITQEEFDAAKAEADAMVFQEYRQDINAPHFVFYVQELLEEEFGVDRIKQGGLVVTTSLDSEMQQLGEQVIADRIEHNRSNFNANNAALVSVDPNNGQIYAMVGSANYYEVEIDGNVNVATSKRQPGSSFKPIAYAAAFLKGYAPSTVVYDVETSFGNYKPKNFSGTFSGPVTMRTALAHSLNIPAVKAGYLATIPSVIELAQNMGIDLVEPEGGFGLPLSLGSGEASPLDMALAYSVFANGGYKMEPMPILKIEDSEGNIVKEYKVPEGMEPVLEPQVAYLMNDVLTDASARPGGFWRDTLSIPDHVNGAKTGTSTKPEDENGVVYPGDTWTIGYVRNLTTAVWTGNSRGEALSLNASGLEAAGPIWKNFMVEAVKQVEKAGFDEPDGITWVKVAKKSGKLPSQYTPSDQVVSAMFANFSVPTEYDESYQVLKIDKVSEKLATEFTPEEAIEERVYYTHHSLLPDNEDWESAVRNWARANGQDDQPPTEYDDVHTAETMNQLPQITITAPVSKAKVSPPILNVTVAIDSPAGVDRVEYYFDDQLMSTVTNSPFGGRLKIPSSLENNSTHTIRAVVFDELLRSSQSSISVKIGADDTPPALAFVYPVDGTKLTAGSSVGVQLDVSDSNGGVASVKYYLNDKLAKNSLVSPFSWQMPVPEELGDYTLRVEAADHAGNTSSASASFEVVGEDNDLGGSSRLTAPASNSFYEQGDSVTLEGFLSQSDQQSIKEVAFQAKKSGQGVQVIGVIPASPSSAVYSVVWDTPPAGTYEVYMSLIMTDGSLKVTNKVPLVVN